MKSFKSRQDWKTPKIDIAPIRIRHRVTGASVSLLNYECVNTQSFIHMGHEEKLLIIHMTLHPLKLSTISSFGNNAFYFFFGGDTLYNIFHRAF